MPLQNHIDPHRLRYTRDDVILLLGLNAGADVNRAIRQRRGFPEKLPGTVPPLWSKKAVDDWFLLDGGRRLRSENLGEISSSITVETLDELADERAELDRRYGGR